MATVEVYFQYRKNSTGTWTSTAKEELTDVGDAWENFERVVTGLDHDSEYEVRALKTSK